MPPAPRVTSSGIYVVVPAYNEAARIGQVLTSMPETVDGIIVVDDASSDATRRVVQDLASSDTRIACISQEANLGVGRAITRGYQALLEIPEASVFVVMAGDGQMNPVDLANVVDPILSGKADYVKGERFTHPDVRDRMPKERYWAGRILSKMTAMATGYPICDSQCGYTALSREACKKLDLDGLWPKYGYPNDMLAQLSERRLRIAQVPVEPLYGPQLESKLKPRHVPGVLFVIGRGYVRRRLATL
jgi:glycosyltransferase involved in cell wall biosynthesis